MSHTVQVAMALAVAAAGAAAGLTLIGGSPDPTEIVTVASGSFTYRAAGEYVRDGVPINAPLTRVAFDNPISIMKRQVSQAEYERCVAAAACRAIGEGPASGRNALPAVGVNWHDASAYAAWLSQETGRRYRLPTDMEWAYAAGRFFRDDAIAGEGNAANPAARWIATYESQAQASEPIDPTPKPFGSFGVNENGLADIGGNVWEWTDSCYVRRSIGAAGGGSAIESCGVRVVEGSHRTYISDFVRDPRGGACSVGAPPSNFGIRLVREDAGLFDRLAFGLRRLIARGA